MNLSRLTLNPRNAAARRDVARPYELHRTLCRAFEHASLSIAGQSGQAPENRLLFRIEPERGPGGPTVLVQSSNVEPDWQPLLDNQYLLQADGPKTVHLSLQENQVLRFRLAANPTKKVNGSRIPLLHDTAPDDSPAGFKTYWDWLRRRAEHAGFAVLQAQDAPYRTAPARKDAAHYEKQQIPHFGVRFDGLLQVRNPDTLLQAIEAGIGPAKAFGFGLLSVAPRHA